MMTPKLSKWQKTILMASIACCIGALSGCSFSVGAGTSGHRVGDGVVATKASFENLVATSLAEKIDNGVTPTIDCGDDDIQLKDARV